MTSGMMRARKTSAISCTSKPDRMEPRPTLLVWLRGVSQKPGIPSNRERADKRRGRPCCTANIARSRNRHAYLNSWWRSASELCADQANNYPTNRAYAENWHKHFRDNRWRQTEKNSDGQPNEPAGAAYIDENDHEADCKAIEECAEKCCRFIRKGHWQHCKDGERAEGEARNISQSETRHSSLLQIASPQRQVQTDGRTANPSLRSPTDSRRGPPLLLSRGRIWIHLSRHGFARFGGRVTRLQPAIGRCATAESHGRACD